VGVVIFVVGVVTLEGVVRQFAGVFLAFQAVGVVTHYGRDLAWSHLVGVVIFVVGVVTLEGELRQFVGVFIAFQAVSSSRIMGVVTLGGRSHVWAWSRCSSCVSCRTSVCVSRRRPASCLAGR